MNRDIAGKVGNSVKSVVKSSDGDVDRRANTAVVNMSLSKWMVEDKLIN